MAKKEMVVAKYRFTLGELKQLGDSTLMLIDRDLAEFNDRGFSATKRTAFEAAIDTFSNFPGDEQMEGMQMSATTARNVARDALESKMRSVFLALKTVFGDKCATYRQFGKANLVQQQDDELIRNAKDMVALIPEYFDDLLDEGITAAKVTLLEAAKNTFDTSIDTQRKAVRLRDMNTEKRITLGNELYELIVKYNDIGKDIWYEVSEARYNDYVIYDAPAKILEKL